MVGKCPVAHALLVPGRFIAGAIRGRRLIAVVVLMALVLAPVLQARAQAVQAFLDRAVIYAGESVLLTIEVEGDVGGDSPDVGRLTKDFHILDRQRGTEVSVVDGRQSSRERWTFEIEPKRSGKLKIPAMLVGTERRTPALDLSVLEADDNEIGGEDLFIEASIEPNDPYVQSQVRYSERLFYAIPVQEGSLDRSESPADLVMLRLGDDQHYVAERNNRRYRVVERKYAVFPQRSGELAIPSITFRGRTTKDGQGDDTIRRGLRVQASSEPLKLSVRPRPAAFSGAHWLPSPELTLSETWSVEPTELRVGEPVTRTIVLEAKGLDSAQLPPLVIATVSGAKNYPDQPSTETRHDGQWMIGVQRQSLAIVPETPGEIVLPAISVVWWDTLADQERRAEIPRRRLAVSPTAGNPPAIEPEVTAVSEELPAAPTVTGSTASAAPQKFWRWFSIGLLGLWVATLIGWQLDRRGNLRGQRNPISQGSSGSEGSARQSLRLACQQNDPHAAAKALMSWAAVKWGEEQSPTNLAELAARLEGDVEPLLELDRTLYSAAASDWRGDRLWQSLEPGLKKRAARSQSKGPAIAPLYPLVNR